MLLVNSLGNLVHSHGLEAFSETFKRLLCCELCKKRISVLAVYVEFGELRECDSESSCAEGVDLFVLSGSLICKLVAGEVEDLKSLVVVCIIDCLKICILRSEAASCSCVDDEENLALIILKGYHASVHCFYAVIINCHLSYLRCYVCFYVFGLYEFC